MAIVKANPNLTLFRDLTKFRNIVTKSFGHRTQFFLQFFFRGAGIYTFAAASFAFVDCICHSVIWCPDLYSGNLYSGNLCSGNLYSGNLYSGNSFGFYLIKKLFSQISKILWKIWQNHFFVARNLAISIYCHEKSGNFTFCH